MGKEAKSSFVMKFKFDGNLRILHVSFGVLYFKNDGTIK